MAAAGRSLWCLPEAIIKPSWEKCPSYTWRKEAPSTLKIRGCQEQMGLAKCPQFAILIISALSHLSMTFYFSSDLT